MHVLIPYAYDHHPQCDEAIAQLKLPNLQLLLRQLYAHRPIGGDEYSLTTPAERVMARSRGWHGADGALPFAALKARQIGLNLGDQAWGRLTPMHWRVGADHITAIPLTWQASDVDDARQLFEAAQPLFTSQGWLLVWVEADYWLTAHASLMSLPTASLDRVCGRNPDRWLPDDPQARAIKLLQNEIQMLWYTHAVNDDRLARGAVPINSLWLSDCGQYQGVNTNTMECIHDLRDGLVGQDWPAWQNAWQHLDRTHIPPLLQRLRRGLRFKITLAGERHARTWSPHRTPRWRRLLGPRTSADLRSILSSL